MVIRSSQENNINVGNTNDPAAANTSLKGRKAALHVNTISIPLDGWKVNSSGETSVIQE